MSLSALLTQGQRAKCHTGKSWLPISSDEDSSKKPNPNLLQLRFLQWIKRYKRCEKRWETDIVLVTPGEIRLADFSGRFAIAQEVQIPTPPEAVKRLRGCYRLTSLLHSWYPKEVTTTKIRLWTSELSVMWVVLNYVCNLTVHLNSQLNEVCSLWHGCSHWTKCEVRSSCLPSFGL